MRSNQTIFRGKIKINKEKNKVRVNKSFLEDGICCETPRIESKAGNHVCTNCGIISGRVFVDNERRAYTAEEVAQRRHSEPLWRDYGPRTFLPFYKKDSKGKLLKTVNRPKFTRLSKIQRSLINSIERNLWEAKPKLKIGLWMF